MIETSSHERLLDTLSDGTMLDHEYILYASQRIIGQREAGSRMEQVETFKFAYNMVCGHDQRTCVIMIRLSST